jgi:hypothetical protein
MVTRCRVRSMMGMVLFIGLALGLADLLKRRVEGFRDLASYHQWMAFQLRNEALGVDGLIAVHPGGINDEALARGLGARNIIAYRASKFHNALGIKYRKAVNRPWLRVEADPPAPYGYDWARPDYATRGRCSDPYDLDAQFELK